MQYIHINRYFLICVCMTYSNTLCHCENQKWAGNKDINLLNIQEKDDSVSCKDIKCVKEEPSIVKFNVSYSDIIIL